MKATIVSSKDLFTHNRMDAGFYVAIDTVKEQVNSLMETLPREEVKEKLKAIDVKPAYLDFLLPIVRGSSEQKNMTRALYEQAVNSDPYAVMALMKANQDQILSRIKSDLDKAQEEAKKQSSSLSSLKP